MKTLLCLGLLIPFIGLELVSAQQWLGSSSSTGVVYRSGSVGIGLTPTSNLHVSAGTAGTIGDCELIIEADKDNDNENDNPFITFTQDNTGAQAFIGLVGDNNLAPQAPKYPRNFQNPDGSWTTFNDFPGTLANSLLLSTNDAKSIQLGTFGFVRLTVLDNGNIGMGTNAPQAKLDVAGDIRWGTTGSFLKTDQGGAIELRGTGIPYIDFSNGPTGDYDARMILLNNDILNIDGASVGIGTTNPGTFKLAVEGKIGAREVQVTVTNPWPDYVFEPTYELRPLEQVETFIITNGRLPDVPSSDEIAKDGHKLGEMDVVLLKKIEELTLYLIEMKNEIESLKSANAKLDEDLALISKTKTRKQ